MLLSMTIRNIALIKDLTIPFHRGLHVLTGETGAGKSIVVDSVNLLLGTRADRELIRSGSDRAYVEALFDVSGNQAAKDFLGENELEADGDILSISREISLSGRNVCRICGIVMPLALLRKLTASLIDIHGQHEHQSLMDGRRHLEFLDGSGGEGHRKLLGEVAAAYEAWREGNREWNRLNKESAHREQRMDTLRFQLEELEGAKLRPEEEEELKQEQRIARHGEKIGGATETAYEALYGTGDHGAVAKLKEAAAALETISGLDSLYESLREKLNGLYYELEDAAIILRDAMARQDFDPARMDEIEERLDVIRRLEKKYGATIPEMLTYKAAIASEFEELANIDERLDDVRRRQKTLLRAYREKAQLLSASRRELAKKLEGEMMAQLGELGMGKTEFVVAFAPTEGEKPKVPQEVGDDEVEFMIAPNPGEPLRSLSKTASGGELSRLMLAMKVIGASHGFAGLMIFDEIDTGISGNIARVVAEKMARIGLYHQVVCVSHLAQIAAMADYHYLVEKQVKDGRTYTLVRELEGGEAEAEVARIIGGAAEAGKASETALTHAKAMLEEASEYKAKQKM